jgi:arylformamidase
MEYIDLTHKIKNELSEYPGDPKTKLNYFKKAYETMDRTPPFRLEKKRFNKK